jgi:hypothetical protein
MGTIYQDGLFQHGSSLLTGSICTSRKYSPSLCYYFWCINDHFHDVARVPLRPDSLQLNMLELFAEPCTLIWCFRIALATGPVTHVCWQETHHKINITFFNLNTTFMTWHEESWCWRRANASGQAVYAYLQIQKHRTIFAFLLLNNTFVTTVGMWAKNTCCSPVVDLIHLKLKLKSSSIEQTDFNVCRLGTHWYNLSKRMIKKIIRERLQMQLRINLFIPLVFNI